MKLDLKKTPKITELSFKKVQAYYYWWEFLKRSERYQSVCRSISKRSENSKTHPFPAICGGITPKNKQLTDLYFDWFYSNFTNEELDTVIIDENDMTFYDVISRLYPLFQDTKEGRFNHVRWRLKWLYEEADADELGALFSGYDHLGGMLRIQKHAFTQKHGRKPDVDEFINFFLKQSAESHFDVILINKHAVPRKDLEPLFKESLQHINIEKQQFDKTGLKYSWAAFLLDGQIRPDSFKMARKAHDLNQLGVPTSEAISTLFPIKANDHNNDHKDLEKTYSGLIDLADKLILNAETGNFPGKYSDKTPRTPKKRGKYIAMNNEKETYTPISTLLELF